MPTRSRIRRRRGSPTHRPAHTFKCGEPILSSSSDLCRPSHWCLQLAPPTLPPCGWLPLGLSKLTLGSSLCALFDAFSGTKSCSWLAIAAKGLHWWLRLPHLAAKHSPERQHAAGIARAALPSLQAVPRGWCQGAALPLAARTTAGARASFHTRPGALSSQDSPRAKAKWSTSSTASGSPLSAISTATAITSLANPCGPS